MRSNKIDEALYGRKYSSFRNVASTSTGNCGCNTVVPSKASMATRLNHSARSKEVCESVTVRCEYESQVYEFEGDTLAGFINWFKGKERSVVGKVYLNIASLLKVKFTGLDNGSVAVFLSDGRKLVMNNLKVGPNKISAQIEGESGRLMYYSHTNESGMLPNLSEILKKDEVEIDFADGATAFAIPWVLVWGAATLIYGIVDAYCDNKVAEQVAACTANGQCSVVNTCGATCVSCG